MIKTAATFALILLLSERLAAQDTQRISGNYQDHTFEQVVADLESRYSLRFYYDIVLSDSLKIRADVYDMPVQEALDAIFGNTHLFVHWQPPNSVILSRMEIRQQLPARFFERSGRRLDEYDVAVFDYAFQDAQSQSDPDNIENRLFEIGPPSRQVAGGNAVLSGYIKNAKTGEALIGAVVYIQEPWIGAATNALGYFSLKAPRGRHELSIKSIGMRETRRQIMLFGDGAINIEVEEDIIPLKEVIVQAERDVNISGNQMGMNRLDIRTMRQMPAALGEVDVMKIALTLPGVQTVGEGASGFNVRGGTADQNLIQINEAPIFNTSHLFGFFSVFNPDVIKSVELYKSGIPANFGGRISSVFDVAMRDGNRKKFVGSGGISPVTARLTAEGPIVADKGSYLIGLRSTYSDWLLKFAEDPNIKNSNAGFFDINARIAQDIDEKNSISLTSYYSRDRFRFNADTLYRYNNFANSLQWSRIFNNRFYGIFSLVQSHYAYDIGSEANPSEAFNLKFGIDQITAKADFNYYAENGHRLEFGIGSNYYLLNPGNLSPLGNNSLLNSDVMEKEQGLETAIYAGDQIEIGKRWSIYAGLRYSIYHYLGPKTVTQYAEGVPRLPVSATGSVDYPAGRVIKTYHGPEYRFSARYAFNPQSSLKFSYNRTRQYLHMLSNTTAISPTDIWKLSDPYLPAQVGDQVSLGLYRNYRQNTIETSVEVYYKKMSGMIDFKGGAELLLNPQIETEVVNTLGKAYGFELLIKKPDGRLNGWISYTYARTFLKSTSEFSIEQVNNGDFYPANWDKPHDFTVISNYRFSRRINFSSNFTYSTGRPITYPVGRYLLNGSELLHYSERNQYRIPDYYRLDLALNLEGNHKIRKLAHSSWTLAVYNVTGRENVYSIFFVSQEGSIQGYKLSVFATAIPTITYNFRF